MFGGHQGYDTPQPAMLQVLSSSDDSPGLSGRLNNSFLIYRFESGQVKLPRIYIILTAELYDKVII